MDCITCRSHACDEKKALHCASELTSQDEILAEYRKEENAAFAKAASYISMSPDGKKPRILETIDMARMCGYKRLGICFCLGLMEEARTVCKILTRSGFTVVPVVCKTGGIPKDLLGIENGGNAMCNPIGQAYYLNEQNTEFNIALGLCVGHDSLFFKYSKAPVTVLAAKDKVLGHNPLACIYTLDNYYKELLRPPEEK
jgi:uncharacterized metal-binding protein